MKAKRMMDKAIQPEYKKLALAIALLWAAQIAPVVLAQDKPPTVIGQPDKASIAQANTIQENDLLNLYRQAALSDPIFSSARYSFLAGKEKKWQGLSVLLPQVSAVGSETKNDFSNKTNPTLSRNLTSRAWNVKLTQPLFNWDKWEQLRQGDMNSAIAEAQFSSAEQDLVLRVTEAYFNVLNAQDTLNLNRNKKQFYKLFKKHKTQHVFI